MAADPGSASLRVEVVFALPADQTIVILDVDPGTTVQQAIARSGIAGRFPAHDLQECIVGVWGRPVLRERPVRDGDRIEIYRELAIEPREARRRLALGGRTMGQRERDD